MAFDLVIRGARVVDGTGRAPFRADVALADGTIAALGPFSGEVETASILDTSDCVLAPGFLDIHTHSDVSLLHAHSGVNKVCQGVTTEVVGNCGFSAFPLNRERRRDHADHLAYLGPDTWDPAWDDLAGYGEALEAAHPIMNVASLVGHGTLRIAAAGMSDEPLTDSERQRMCRLLDEALEQGAYGFSTGLTYVPSMFGSTEEIAMLAGIAARHSALYTTHARATLGEYEPIEEAITVGRTSGARVEYSHMAINDPRWWGQAESHLELFARAQAEGVAIQFDVYPYDASASSLSQYLPTWLIKSGWPNARACLVDPTTRARAVSELAKGWYGSIPWLWDRVLITHAPSESEQVVGRTLAELIELWGCDGPEVVLRLYERWGNALQVALFYRTEDDMRSFLSHPDSVVASDSVALSPTSDGSRPHPRFYGTFPRVLGRYVRDGHLLTLEQAIRKMTGEPADRFGIAGRGYVKPGCAADLVLFRPEQVGDMATFTESTRLPVGIEGVWVNGELTVERGRWNGTGAGQVLRHQG